MVKMTVIVSGGSKHKKFVTRIFVYFWVAYAPGRQYRVAYLRHSYSGNKEGRSFSPLLCFKTRYRRKDMRILSLRTVERRRSLRYCVHGMLGELLAARASHGDVMRGRGRARGTCTRRLQIPLLSALPQQIGVNVLRQAQEHQKWRIDRDSDDRQSSVLCALSEM